MQVLCIDNFAAPAYATGVLKALMAQGHEAYFVGGCVRDTLLGGQPHDWDITTSATPEQVKAALQGYKTIDTGLKHGTVTAVADSHPVEVTTYRIDGEYSDHRRPDTVTFTRSLTEDLRRRDFTVNAIAYNPITGDMRDPFGGAEDLKQGQIRCVGKAEDRFSEDPLRILRALRFAAVLGFPIEPGTAQAIHQLSFSLEQVAQERITSELRRMITGRYVYPVLMEYSDVMRVVVTELGACIGFPQNNPYHRYDVWEHIALSVQYAPQDEIIRLAMLFHDIGKPFCYQDNEDGRRSFKGHAHISRSMTEHIMRRMRFDNKTIETVCLLVDNHTALFGTGGKRQVRRLLAKVGEENFHRLIQIRLADVRAQGGKDNMKNLAQTIGAGALLDEVLAETPPLSVRDLAVDGHDMMALGLHGPAIRKVLSGLLAAVLDGEVANEWEALLTYLASIDAKGEK